MPIPVNIEGLLRKRKTESNCIEADKISILSYAGPERSISWDTIQKAERSISCDAIQKAEHPISCDAIQKAERLKSHRYHNRRLGDYLKELQLSEGRATGIPTIQDELRKNGFELAKIETDIHRATLTEITTKLSSPPINISDYQCSKKTGGYVLIEKGETFIKKL